MQEMDELIGMLEDAQAQLFEIIDTLKYIAEVDPDKDRGDHYRRYLITKIEMATGESNWTTCDPTINEWIEALTRSAMC